VVFCSYAAADSVDHAYRQFADAVRDVIADWPWPEAGDLARGARRPPGGVWFGWKNFYDEDQPLRSVAQTMAVEPRPVSCRISSHYDSSIGRLNGAQQRDRSLVGGRADEL